MTSRDTTVLITGASGLIGSALGRRFLREPAALYALVRQRQPNWAEPRRTKVGLLASDITRPLLGLPASAYQEMASTVTEILHCAARTDFRVSQAEAEQVNVEGTRNVLAFASRCKKLQKVGVLSTAYVAGRRQGLIREEDLDHRWGFVNAYEASKYRMERLLRKASGHLPIAVYRLSTVVGNARSGRVEQFNFLHRALRLYHRGWVPMVPGEATGVIDLISSDYAAAAVFHLFHVNFAPGKTYHIVAGEKNSLRLGELLESTEALFARFDGCWRRRAVTPPPIVALETFRLLERSVHETGNVFLEQIASTMGTFAPQLSYPKLFADPNTRAGLRGSGIRPAPLTAYYPRIIRYCLRSRWGED
jgi:thioester reductase-like protein